MAGPKYRCQQFFRALFARVSDDERAMLRRRLNPAQLKLFEAMSLADRRHSLDVYNLLNEWGYHDDDLLCAALLHDVGKSLVPIRLWHRVAVVLLGKQRIARLASAEERSWRYPFYVHRNHAILGTTLAACAGCSSRVIVLIGSHASPGDDEQSQALYRADCMC